MNECKADQSTKFSRARGFEVALQWGEQEEREREKKYIETDRDREVDRQKQRQRGKLRQGDLHFFKNNWGNREREIQKLLYT